MSAIVDEGHSMQAPGTLLLTRSDVARVLSLRECIAAVEEGLRARTLHRLTIDAAEGNRRWCAIIGDVSRQATRVHRRGTSGRGSATKPSRLGICTAGNVFSVMTVSASIRPFMCRMNAVSA